jgi:hypothetical protein
MDTAEELASHVETVDEPPVAELVRAHAPGLPVQIIYAEPPAKPRSYTAEVILFSLGALFAGLLYSTRDANEAYRLSAQTTTMEAESAAIMKASNLSTAEQARRLMQFNVLSKRGVPVASVVWQVAQAASPNVSLASITVSPLLAVRVEGEATSEQAMLQGLNRMRDGNAVRDLKLATFRHPDPAKSPTRFVIVGRAITLGDVRK